jgi:hypothetical protein
MRLPKASYWYATLSVTFPPGVVPAAFLWSIPVSRPNSSNVDVELPDDAVKLLAVKLDDDLSQRDVIRHPEFKEMGEHTCATEQTHSYQRERGGKERGQASN